MPVQRTPIQDMKLTAPRLAVVAARRGPAEGSLCARRGVSRVYIQLTANGEKISMPGGGPTSGDGSAPPQA